MRLPLLALAAGALVAAAPAATPTATKTGPIVAAYIEVNSNSLLNTGKYQLADGSNVFDIALIFASNIKADSTGAAYVYNNPNVQALLGNATTQIRPLQKQGIKVLLSLLGGGDPVGIANFASQAAATAFAARVADEITKYGLDGVDLDDEYAAYPTSGAGQPNNQSIGWLIGALRTKLPGKLITYYDIGPSSESLAQDPPSVGAKLDFSWNPYYGSFSVPQVPGLSKSKLAPAAISFSQTSSAQAASLAKQTVQQGYGAYLTYNLVAGNNSAYVSAFTQQLYGQKAIYHP